MSYSWNICYACIVGSISDRVAHPLRWCHVHVRQNLRRACLVKPCHNFWSSGRIQKKTKVERDLRRARKRCRLLYFLFLWIPQLGELLCTGALLLLYTPAQVYSEQISHAAKKDFLEHFQRHGKNNLKWALDYNMKSETTSTDKSAKVEDFSCRTLWH